MTDAVEIGLSRRLAERAYTDGPSVAFRFLGRSSGSARELTWADLWREGRRQALQLAAAGLRHRQIGILCPDPRDFVISLVAVILAEGVAVPMPATLSRRSAPRIRAIVRAADLAGLIAPQSLLTADWLADIEWPAGLKRISVERLQAATATGDIGLEADLSRPLLLQFTSGSTGTPQGVLLSHANVASNCAAITDAYGLDDESVGLSWLPLHHDMGLVGHVLMPLWLGGRSALMDPLRFLQRPLTWLQAVTEERATITSAPNFAYELCNRADAADHTLDLDLRSLTTAVCGGEPVMPETMETFIDRFAGYGFRRSAFAPSYGLAEATLLVASGKTLDGPRSADPPETVLGERPRLTNLGPPVKGARVRIVDPASGTALPDDAIGEIEVAGAGVGCLIGAEPAEWMKTGDLGFLSGGHLCVAGRSKELLILRGQNVFPAEIEAAALGVSPAIVPGGLAAVGIARDGTQAMILVVEIRSTTAETKTREELRKAIREGVALTTGHVPDDVVLVKAGTLPRTTSGKLRRTEIAALYELGEIPSALAESNRPKVPFEHA